VARLCYAIMNRYKSEFEAIFASVYESLAALILIPGPIVDATTQLLIY
jgi:hypothetical protein